LTVDEVVLFDEQMGNNWVNKELWMNNICYLQLNHYNSLNLHSRPVHLCLMSFDQLLKCVIFFRLSLFSSLFLCFSNHLLNNLKTNAKTYLFYLSLVGNSVIDLFVRLLFLFSHLNFFFLLLLPYFAQKRSDFFLYLKWFALFAFDFWSPFITELCSSFLFKTLLDSSTYHSL